MPKMSISPCYWMSVNTSSITKKHRRRIRNFKPIRGYNEKLKISKRRFINRYDITSGGGYGLKSYILSLWESQYSDFWPQNTSYFNSIIQQSPYYKCYATPRLQSQGVWNPAVCKSICAHSNAHITSHQ